MATYLERRRALRSEARTDRGAVHEGCPVIPSGDLWVFAYGSLMWNPGFAYTRAAPALLRGYHRSFCVYSVRFRGTPEQPGLVLGLDRGGACRGIAFLVAEKDIPEVLSELWAREMPRLVYHARLLPVDVDSRRVRALAFTADRRHESYAGHLEPERIAQTIASCCGLRGPNIDYLANTLKHLEDLGIRERRLHRLLQAVERLTEGNPSVSPL